MRVTETTSWIVAAVLVLTFTVATTTAQSLDINAPTPITTSSVVGQISARDIGDARFTDHFYTFVGNPGDLLITVETRNLNGDVDVFSAAGLRPLMKFTVYAESAASINKGIFLRQRQDLILRVQARTPNDDQGAYQIRFGGSFEAIAGVPQPEETEEDINAATAATPKRGRRVSSVGARIDAPEPPVEELASSAPTPEPTPEATPTEPAPEAKPEESKPAEVEAATTTPSRNTRSRRPTGRRTTSRTRPHERPAPAPSEETTTPPESRTESEEETRRSASSKRGSRRRETTPPEPPKEIAEPEPPSGPYLIVETLDGTLINRPMSSLRRVMVEGGMVVIVPKDGRVQRVPLNQVVRLSITP